MKNNLFLFCLAIFLVNSCSNDATKEAVHQDSVVANVAHSTIDSVSNPQAEADYILAHLDDPRKPNRVINTYAELIEKSLLSTLPARTYPDAKDSIFEFFVTKQFYKDFLAAKPLQSILQENDEVKFMGDGVKIEIPEKQTFLNPTGLGEVVEMGPIHQYQLNDSIFAFTFSELNDPAPGVKQFSYATYICVFNQSGQYIGGWETNYSSYGNHGAGYESEAAITKDGKISITYSDTDGDTYLITDVRTIFEITPSQHISRIEYKKSKRQQ
ncbi:MAG: hypothetical protein ACTHJT_01250 [Cytophaga sp.]|uniref:hypothetical protein n=1 Tax=Cytophaga sp. TaxID=29535 RepID=UPI003F7F5305